MAGANVRQLSSLPNEIRRYSAEVADFIDEHVDRVADIVRETLAASQWIPEYARPRPRPPPVVPVAHVVPATMLEKVQGWLWRHKILVGATALALGLITYRSYRNSRLRRRTRKARRAKSGGRIEVVVIAAAPSLPLTKSLALDMEQKGFIVFVVCGGVEEEKMVYNLNRPDIKPLLVDMTDVRTGPRTLRRVKSMLLTFNRIIARQRQRVHRTLLAVSSDTARRGSAHEAVPAEPDRAPAHPVVGL